MNEKEFNPYKFDYKTYMLETHNLCEMPAKMPKTTLSKDYIDNSYEAMQIEKRARKIGVFQIPNEEFRIFTELDGSITSYYLLRSDRPLLVLSHDVEYITTPIVGMVNKSIWHFIQYKSLMEYWFEKEIIPKNMIIISDNIQTEHGFDFWKRLYSKYVSDDKTHKMYIVDFVTGNTIIDLNKEDELNNYCGDGNHKFRYVLEKV